MIEIEPADDRLVRAEPLERAALVPTSLGTAGAVITLPPAPTGLGMLILQGLETNRSGVNAVWTRTARALAAVGIVALRVDAPGIGDSSGIAGGRPSHRPMLAEVVTWFRRETAVGRVGAIGACYGAKPALSLAARGDLDGPVALVTPAFGLPFSRTFPGRMAHRIRRRVGRPRPVDRAVIADLATVATRGEVFALLGERDRQAAASLASARRRLGHRGAIQEEIVPGERLHAFPSAVGQSEAIARLTAWAVSADEPATKVGSRGDG